MIDKKGVRLLRTTIDLEAYDTDKSAAYMAEYEREFGHLFEEPVRLLELGVQRGGSMLLFRDLFPAGTIVGLDLNEIKLDDDTGRLHIYQGFQQDPLILDKIAAELAPDGFDIIIDDASHLGRYTSESFWRLFPHHLKGGGVYVIDDWSVGYHGSWPDGHDLTRELRTDGVAAVPYASRPPGPLEVTRRRARTAARPIAERLNSYPLLKDKLREAFLRLDGATIQHRFPSHDYGMVGFIKQLIDECAVDAARKHWDASKARPSEKRTIIQRITTTPSQTFVWKAL